MIKIRLKKEEKMVAHPSSYKTINFFENERGTSDKLIA